MARTWWALLVVVVAAGCPPPAPPARRTPRPKPLRPAPRLDERSLDDLVLALRHDDAAERARAARTLGRFGMPLTTAEAMEQLAAAPPGEREEATAAVYSAIEARSRAGPAVPALIAALDDPDARVREEVLTALGGIGPAASSAGPALARLLESSDPARLRAGAAWALGKVAADPDVCLPLLLRTLERDIPPVRTRAALALGRLRPVALEAVAPLTSALGAASPELREKAAAGLGAMGAAAAEAVPALVERLGNDAVSAVRMAAAHALEAMGPAAAPALEALLLAMEAEDWKVRRGAAGALGAIGPGGLRGVPQLLACLESPHWTLRHDAVVALGRLQARDALAVLRTRSEPDGRVRAAIDEAIHLMQSDAAGK